MKYWLVKSEPNAWSWDEHVAAGIAEWDGVRSHQACNNMKAMKIGDRAFFYHSVKEKQVVGVLEVASAYRPDPTDQSERFGMVDFKALKSVTWLKPRSRYVSCLSSFRALTSRIWL